MSIETELNNILNKRRNIIKELRIKKESIRKIINVRRKKPVFLRNVWWKFKKFENDLKWRKPRGKDNPMRLSLKGYPPIAGSGYGMPDQYRFLHPSGFEPVVVSNSKMLLKLDPKKHIVYIASTVSLKKRLEIISIAKSKGFKLANA